MPKLDLVNAKQIKFQGGDIKELKGPYSIYWKKPSTSLPTQLSLLRQPDDLVGWTYEPISENSARLVPDGSSSRCHCSWIVENPNIYTGHRLKGTLRFPAGANRVLVRTGFEGRIGSSSGTIYDNSNHTDGSYDATLQNGALQPWFGFLTVASRELIITNFQIIPPSE